MYVNRALICLLLTFVSSIILCAEELHINTAESRSPTFAQLVPTPAERDSRLGWWREARFGMFIHWGVYSTLSGTWHGQRFGGYAEHIQRAAKISMNDYRKEVVGAFNPNNFDADEWVKLAKQTGMGYLIITAKHHDGFAMYNSEVSDYNIVKATPFHRDPMIELRDACKRQGVHFGFYYSHAFDWGEKDAPGNDWDYQNPGGDLLLHGVNWWLQYPEILSKAHNYVDRKAIPQLRELIELYDPDIFWFDTAQKLPPEENLRILAAVRKMKPSLVINGRLVHGAGDYANTADRPAEFQPTLGDWEGVPTTNESYGYNENDDSHKSSEHFIRLLAKSAARGGNVLLNVGPKGNGEIDQKDIAILSGIGRWWKINGESIHGTDRTPLPVQAWGESTLHGKILYLHVFMWPKKGRVVIGGLRTSITKAWLLSDPSYRVRIDQSGPDQVIYGPSIAPDVVDSVIACEMSSEIRVDQVRVLSDDVALDTFRVFDAHISPSLSFGAGKVKDAHVLNWKSLNQMVCWQLRTELPFSANLRLIYDAPTESKGKIIEGDAGAEQIIKHSGAGGTYSVSIGKYVFKGYVRNGSAVIEKLGHITLSPGLYELKISADTISGDELFRPRLIEVIPECDK